MKKMELQDLVELFCLEERERAALLRDLEIREVLKLFKDFIRKKKITLKELSSLDESDLVEYYLQLREYADDDEQEIAKHVKILFKFLKYIESQEDISGPALFLHEPKALYGGRCA